MSIEGAKEDTIRLCVKSNLVENFLWQLDVNKNNEVVKVQINLLMFSFARYNFIHLN